MDNYDFDREKPIGKGTFGTVYRGVKRDTGETVALKVIRKRPRGDTELREWQEECKIQSELRHDNIIRLFDSFETDTELVVVMEFAEYSLFDLLLKVGILKVDHVQVIAGQLISALYYLHSRGIVHRDLKPQNVLIGKDGRYKLCDFGFARTMDRNYYLTSTKGTPLYMAPEVINQVPYDQKAELWSLGCILYELMVGTPPFPTPIVDHLHIKIKEPVVWYPQIRGNCLSFLQGLLEKNPKERLSWQDLLNHPFVANQLNIIPTEDEFSLTRVLSSSQEIQKEQQRQEIERKLEDEKRIYKEAKRNYKLTHQQLFGYNKVKPVPDFKPFVAPSSNLGLYKAGTETEKHKILPEKTPVATQLTKKNELLKKDTAAPRKLTSGINPGQPNLAKWREPNSNIAKGNESDDSSCDAVTSSSGSDDDDDETVILDEKRSNDSLPGSFQKHQDYASQLKNLNQNASPVWRSRKCFDLPPFASDDKPIETDEWVGFIMTTTKEVIQTPGALCDKEVLRLVVAPLINHYTGSGVIAKIASLLSSPFAVVDKSDTQLTQNLENIYLYTKLVPNLLYSCKMIVRRRWLELEQESVDIDSIASVLTEEDVEGMDKSIRLICYLVHSNDDFVIQFCSSIGLLSAVVILKLFLQLDKSGSRLATDTLGILCHVMRTNPSNFKILEDLLLDESDQFHDSELRRLLTHKNPLILSRILRITGYLVIHSERTKGQIVQNNQVWRILRNASNHADPTVRSAATFAVGNIRHLSAAAPGSSTKPD